LDFHDGCEELTVNLTFLDGKCAGQELLERFAIEAGITTHTDSYSASPTTRQFPCTVTQNSAILGFGKSRGGYLRFFRISTRFADKTPCMCG
jgi:hypothetical protein